METPYTFTSFFLVAKKNHSGCSYHFLLTISDVQVYYRIANDQDTAPQLLTVGGVKTERC